MAFACRAEEEKSFPLPGATSPFFVVIKFRVAKRLSLRWRDYISTYSTVGSKYLPKGNFVVDIINIQKSMIVDMSMVFNFLPSCLKYFPSAHFVASLQTNNIVFVRSSLAQVSRRLTEQNRSSLFCKSCRKLLASLSQLAAGRAILCRSWLCHRDMGCA